MMIRTIEECPLVTPVRKGFRGGSIGFRDLMQGVEGSPNNYGLQMVHIDGEYFTPRHRHHFEQVRVMLEGSFSFGEGFEQHQGSVGYFCEGCYYTQKDLGKSITLLLQIGGPSKQGFMSRTQLRGGIETLAHKGEFNDGVFTWHDGNGQKHNQDSYEAVWEHVHGRSIEYPKPQYRSPVIIEPERFSWRRLSDGVTARQLGTFTEYSLGLQQMQFDAGARGAIGATQSTLIFVMTGSGTVNQAPFARWSTIRLGAGEVATISASAMSELFVFFLPDFAA
jgi:hypothetical protein